MDFLSASTRSASKNILSTSLVLSSVLAISGCYVDDVTQVVDEEVTDDIFVDVSIPGEYANPVASSVSDASVGRTGAAGQMQPGYAASLFNRDYSMRLSGSDDVTSVADGSVIGDLWDLSGMQSFRNAVWSKIDADVIFGTVGLKFVSLNIITREIKVIRDVGERDGFVSTSDDIHLDGYRAISANDDYVVLSDVTRGGTKVIVIDIRTGERCAWIEDIYSHPDFRVMAYGTPGATMELAISLSGDHIVIQGSDGHHLFDGELSYIGKLASGDGINLTIDTVVEDSIDTGCPVKRQLLADGRAIYFSGSDNDPASHEPLC